jgi:hypothetical protein
MGGPTP